MTALKKTIAFFKNLFKEDMEIKMPINKSFISVNGIKKKILEDRVYSQIVNALMKAPIESRPMACICIKKKANYYFGIFRMGSSYGHYTKKIYGNTQAEVIQNLLVKIKKDLTNFPEKLESNPKMIQDCSLKSCPASYARAYTHRCFF